MRIPISGPDEGGIIDPLVGETIEEPIRCEATEAAPTSEIATRDPAELARLLREKTQEALAYYDRLLRLQADLENYKKRAEKERAEYFKYANEELIKNLLPVLDDLERAIACASQDSQGERLLEGIKLIQCKLKDVLDKAGLKEVPALRKEFDPHYQEAVMTTHTQGDDDNIVTQELQKGYLLSGKVVRPSKVVVAIKGDSQG